jgi:ADP-ribose pyrophosphatase
MEVIRGRVVNRLSPPYDPLAKPVEKSTMKGQGASKLGKVPGDRVIHAGERVELVLRTVRTNSGREITREVCLHPGAVIILPVADDGRIVLIRNRRHTVFETLLELPAGTLERDEGGRSEDPELCAARELTEETGYTARTLERFGWFYTSPGILTEKMYAFIARGLTAGAQALEDNEQIETALFEPGEILALIRENLIVDAKTIATLLKYLVGRPGPFPAAAR